MVKGGQALVANFYQDGVTYAGRVSSLCASLSLALLVVRPTPHPIVEMLFHKLRFFALILAKLYRVPGFTIRLASYP